jgi:transcriptional regulator with XRE-family HTH domain
MANNEKEKNLEFAEIIKEARGDRSLREYAEDSGVSYMTIYKAERGECVPSPKTIKKLSSVKAKPQNGATYERMMVAAGYQDNDAVSETASVLAQNMVEEMYESDKLNNNGFRFGTAGKIDVRKQELHDEYLSQF